MTDLITKLQDATEGSAVLDMMVAKEIYPTLVEGDTGEQYFIDGEKTFLSPYTRSMDAKLPWEKIVLVQSPIYTESDRWRAACLCDDGPFVYAYAKTEPLARRAAALKAHDISRIDANSIETNPK